MLASHSSSGGISERALNSAGVNDSLLLERSDHVMAPTPRAHVSNAIMDFIGFERQAENDSEFVGITGVYLRLRDKLKARSHSTWRRVVLATIFGLGCNAFDQFFRCHVA